MNKLLIATICIPSGLAAEALPALYDVTGVEVDDRLYIRSTPSAEAPEIGSFAPTQENIEVTAIENRWMRVNHNEQTGWVYERFMSRPDQSQWSDIKTTLGCFGVEPFWSSTHNFNGIEINTIDSPSFELLTKAIGEPMFRGGDTEITRIYGVGPYGIMASLRGETCSDGMSDRTYGISAMLSFLGEDGFFQLSGCCTINQVGPGALSD